MMPSEDERTLLNGSYHPSVKGKSIPLGISSPSSPASSSGSSFYDYLDEKFKLTERNTDVATEVRAGFVTFVTMAYILIVNAEILSKSGVGAGGEWMSYNSIVTATALSAAVGSAMVGIFGNLPFGLAPGMGLNSYFTYGICLRLGLTWEVALSTVFMQGVIFMILSLVGACNFIQYYAPPCIKKSITVGLGLFQALIGFELMRLVVSGNEVLLQLGDIYDPKIWLSLGGLVMICILLIWKVKAAMLVGMVFITLISWVTGLSPPPEAIVEVPSFRNSFLAIDFGGFFTHIHNTLPVTLVMLFVSIFDTAGVQFMAGQQAGLLDSDDRLPGAKAAFFSAGFATSFGALFGSSPIIIHTETCAGIQDGARTGLHSVTVAILFILAMPFTPIIRAVPPIATAAPLVIVGMFMMMAAKYIEWEAVEEALPAFLTATILPLTYSIANGMVAGLASYVLLKGSLLLGKKVAPERFESEEEEEEEPVVLPGRRSHLATPKTAFADPMPGSPVMPYMKRHSIVGKSPAQHQPLQQVSVGNGHYGSNNTSNYDSHF